MRRLARDQQVPIVVADLVAKMAEQGAIGLVELGTAVFARRVVGLLQGQGDDTAVVAGEHRRTRNLLVEEMEAQAVDRVFVAGGERQVEAQQ